MIVREIKQFPDEVLKNFDWFNDYKDTRAYLRSFDDQESELIARLDEGNKAFWDAKTAKVKEKKEEPSLREAAMALYKPPFRFYCGYIKDSNGEMVADQDSTNEMKGLLIARIRGWGRISYMKDAAELQDMVGELVAEALTEFWSKNQ